VWSSAYALRGGKKCPVLSCKKKKKSAERLGKPVYQNAGKGAGPHAHSRDRLALPGEEGGEKKNSPTLGVVFLYNRAYTHKRKGARAWVDLIPFSGGEGGLKSFSVHTKHTPSM